MTSDQIIKRIGSAAIEGHNPTDAAFLAEREARSLVGDLLLSNDYIIAQHLLGLIPEIKQASFDAWKKARLQ